MKTEIKDSKNKYFSITGSYDTGKAYRDNKTYRIVARNCKDAVDLFVSLHPDAEIHNVNYVGPVDYITESSLESICTGNQS